MAPITYSLLDAQMTEDDKVFFQELGRRVAEFRNEAGMTQVQLAHYLGMSQQVTAAYEAGRRKIPASMLPKLSRLFAVPVEELIGMQEKGGKRGPISKLQRQMEQISLLPRAKQKFVMDMLETVIKQDQTAAK